MISIPLFCILFSAAALYVFQQQRTDLTQWISRAFQAGARIQAIVTLLTNAETASRGFLLTRDEKFLEPYALAVETLDRRLAQLRESLADSPSQQKRMDRVAELSRRRLAALETIIAGKLDSTLVERLERDRQIMAQIESEFTAMREEESRLWVTRIAAETALRQRLTIAAYSIAGFSLVAGIVAMSLFAFGIVRRSQLLRTNAERLAHGEPLLELPAGADEIGRLGTELALASRRLADRENQLRALNLELDQRVKLRSAELERETAIRKESEEQLRQSQKMEALGRLAGGVAHDFNNVLTIILGYGQMLSDKHSADPQARRYVDEILRASEHARSLTQQLLAFSRRQMVQARHVNLNAMVERSDLMLKRLIGEDIELRTVTAADLGDVLVDEGQIEQVLLNLAVNARDAMPGGGKITIETANVDLDETFCRHHLDCKPGRYVMLAVSDTGEGIPDEVQPRIFEPFFTTKEKGKGTGLGLSMVYGIVQTFGGTVWVYSQVGIGTTFKVYLPVAEGGGQREDPKAAVEAVRRSAGTILLVEDAPPVRRLAKEILVGQGFTVLEADGPDAARKLSRGHAGPIDLLLTDVIMPKMNGRELARELTADRKDMKVLFMSGYTDDAILLHGILDSGVAFLEKPFLPETLINKVREVMFRSMSAGGTT